jgi:hypothetical protein
LWQPVALMRGAQSGVLALVTPKADDAAKKIAQTPSGSAWAVSRRWCNPPSWI